jgi:hypothetical protein
MQMPKRNPTPSRNFRDAVELFQVKGASSGEIALAGFLAEHAGIDRDASMGSIGALPRVEALALNALVSKDAAFVLLGCGSFTGPQSYAAQLIGELEGLEFEVRMQFADLTLAGRWPQLLNAIARTNIGILGVDAHWAGAEPRFWTSLEQFMKDRRSLVYIRRMLDFQNSQASISLIRSMPAQWEQNVVAATPTSIWFAHEAESAARIRLILRQSGVFPEAGAKVDDDFSNRPVIVASERGLDLIDRAGRFPRAVLFTNNQHRAEIEFKSGWSAAESDGCWTGDHESVLQVRVPSSMAGAPGILNVTGNAWVAPDRGEQVIEVGLGNEPSQWIETEFTDSQQIKNIAIDCTKANDDSGVLVLRFRVRNPGSPSAYGVPDERLLGFKCRAISLFA